MAKSLGVKFWSLSSLLRQPAPQQRRGRGSGFLTSESLQVPRPVEGGGSVDMYWLVDLIDGERTGGFELGRNCEE